MLVCATLFWAGNFMVGKFAFFSDIPPMTLVFFRWSLVWIILIPFTYNEVVRHKEVILGNLPLLFFLALTSVGLFNSFTYLSLVHTQVINASLFNTAIPAIIIFQSALWIAYLSKDSVSNGFISTFVDGLGDLGENILRLFSFFGWIIASTISSSLDSKTSFGTFSLHHNVADLVFISLLISSILYLMKKIQSVYVLIFVFIFSFILRLIEVEDFSYDWLMFSSIIISSIILTSLLSIPLSRYRYKKQLRESIIDISVISDKSQLAEASYQTPTPARIGSFMDQAPVTKPRRPSRRSEYELYEWVLLLANLILWPAVFMISLILGSGVEVYGNSYNMDENYLMLLGPLFLTLFFFGILFKMDKNARDGSLYAAEKQSYLEEMEKYLKARTAYLELVTLQAESKKQEIVSVSSEE